MHIFLWCYLWLCTFSTKWNALIYSFGPSVRYFISQKLKKISEPNFLHLVEQSSNRCTMILLNPLGAVGLTAILLNLVDFWHVNIKLSRSFGWPSSNYRLYFICHRFILIFLSAPPVNVWNLTNSANIQTFYPID